MVTYPSSFSRFRCTVSEKSTSEIFSHFPFFSKSVHPFIMNLLWEMHTDDRNMLTEFQLNPVYRLGEMAKTSSGFVTMQQQQLERAELNVETIACSSNLARGHLHKEKQSKIISQASCNQRIQACNSRIRACSSKKLHEQLSGFRYVTKPIPLLHESNSRTA